MLKYKYIFQIKNTVAISSNSTRKLSWFEISKMLIAVLKKIIIFWHTFVPYSGTPDLHTIALVMLLVRKL